MARLPTDLPSTPDAGAPVPPDAPTHGSARRIAWARRRRALSGYAQVYRSSKQGMFGLVILVFFLVLAVIAPYVVNQDQIHVATATGPILHPPAPQWPLGTDSFGRQVIGQLVWGTRISLLIGITATLGTMLIGSAVGIGAGYFGGKTDTALSALTNWFLVIPWLALAIVLAEVNPFHLPKLGNIILVIAITSWAGSARLIRSQALSVKERTYVERSRALGSGNWHLITRHILPNVMPVIFANTILTVAIAILSEAALGFIGLGDPNQVSWGLMLNESYSAGALTAGFWWWFIPPGLAIVAFCFGVTLCGYALDEILNPKLRSR
jgi:peptide/nickel transport system permease protein